MTQIVLDTSVIVPDYRLKGASLRAVLRAARDLRDSVAVPAVVLDEVVNKFREALSVAVDELRATEGRLSKLLPQKPSPLELDTTAELEKYRDWLTARFKAVGIEVLEYPMIDHRDVVRRALQRRKPFTKDGQRGYRDALIWETLLEELKLDRNELFFVSSNKNDFADPGNAQLLHPDLLHELSTGGPEHGRLVFFSSLEDLLARGIGPRQKVIPDLTAQIDAGKLGALDLNEWLLTELPGLIAGSRLQWVGPPSERHRGDWTATNLRYLQPPQLQSTHNLTEKSILIVVALMLRATLVPKQTSLDFDNEANPEAGFSARVFVSASIEVERESQRPTSVSSNHVVVLDETLRRWETQEETGP